EALNHRLARASRADPSGWDLTQLLRLVGRSNHKYTPPVPVRLVSLDPTLAYDPAWLDATLPALGARARINGHVAYGEAPAYAGPAARGRAEGEAPEKAQRAPTAGISNKPGTGDGSDSATALTRPDASLLSLLAFWPQDPAQLDRLYRQSGLYRDKWERADYRALTLSFVLGHLRETWHPAGPGPSVPSAASVPTPFSKNGTGDPPVWSPTMHLDAD